MSSSWQEILQGNHEEKPHNAVMDAIIRCYGQELEEDKLPNECRAVLLSMTVSGMVGNGGFRYLFEGFFRKDLDYKLSIQAFEDVGCPKAASIFKNVLKVFPNSIPPNDQSKRLKIYLKTVKKWRTPDDLAFFDATKKLDEIVDRYIQENIQSFLFLEEFYNTHPVITESIPEESEEKEDHPIFELPYFARIAYLAHLGREVLPKVREDWPDAEDTIYDSLREVLALAEFQAETGETSETMKSLKSQCLIIAGKALSGHNVENQGPKSAVEGTRVAAIAKLCEYLADACNSNNNEECNHSFIEAYQWGFSGLEQYELLEEIDHFQKLHKRLRKLAKKNNWTDMTKIPAQIWDMI